MFQANTLKKIIIAIITLHFLALAYFLLFHNFFQQDEWHGFGIILSQGTRYITVDKSLAELLLGDRVGARILTFGLFNLFALNPIPYGLVALLLHFSNTAMVFIIGKKLTKQTIVGLLSALLFLTNEIGHEAYSWFGTMNGSATAVLLFLISVYFFLKFIDTKENKFVIISSSTLWLSFLFKEIGAFAFIFYPAIFFTYNSLNKKGLVWFLKRYSPFIIIAFIMLTYFAKTVLFIPGDQANYVSSNESFISTVITHSLQYPLEGIVQTLIPNSVLFTISPFTTQMLNPSLPSDSLEFLIASQTNNAEITTIAILSLLCIAFIIFIKKFWNKIPNALRKTLWISLAITILSFLPYTVINRSFSYLDSRHYYMASVGISIFLATFVFVLNNLTRNRLIKLLILATTAAYIIMHEAILVEDFKLLIQRSDERQLFIKQLEALVPKLPKKTIFYITGDSGGYYGLTELKVPFQSGPGHMLMVLYTTKGQLNSSFFNEKTLNEILDVGFLYDILGQGYRQIDNQGFGYYYDKQTLQKDVDKKLFSEGDVISLYYDSKNKKLIKKDF